jgi:lipopolysaccharide biosynthesis regulator YciM
MEKNPESSGARRNLIRFYHKAGKTNQAMEMAIELADKIFTGVVHRCRVCGNKSHDMLWRCPQCGEWDTFENDTF